MELSHSKIYTILDNPMTYYLNYEQGIRPLKKSSALEIGSAVHWGIEHDTENLDEYFQQESSFREKDTFTKEQLLAEAMVHGYLKNKEKIFNEILGTGDERLHVLDETHELALRANVKSEICGGDHEFLGIIDLLLWTKKGFILIDYKTSSQEPDFTKYLDQIYRYIYLLQKNFPDVPVYKIGIINLKKTMIYQKKNENEEQFLNRIKFEYELNDEKYITYHEFDPQTLDKDLYNAYVKNLEIVCDHCASIVSLKHYFINYSNVNGSFGKSEYYDIFYHTPDCHLLYDIRDSIYDETLEMFVDRRPCISLDMKVLEEKDRVLNHYSDFKYIVQSCGGSIKKAIATIQSKYLYDNKLLETYKNTYYKEGERDA